MDDNDERPVQGIGSFIPKLSEEELRKKFFLIMPANSLFGNSWKNLKEGLCPICSKKLKTVYRTKALYCNSTHHLKPFFIKADKYKEIISYL